MASKYDPLVEHLNSAEADEVTLELDMIDRLVRGLPSSARDLKSWWANDSVSHSQSLAWLAAGWRVARADLDSAEITFERATRSSTFARPGAARVEAVAGEFRRALRDGDSVFAPGTQIWTQEHCAVLVGAFVDQPDISGASFDDKLAKQLDGVAAGPIQLFAEIYALDLLPLSDYTGARKRACIATPFEIAGTTMTLPPDIDAALDVGVLNGGVAFKTRRYFQLSYLIQVFAGLLAKAQDERASLLEDPVAFRTAIDAIPTVNAPSQRFALLYLMFPDYYLPIAKREHRNLIRDAFLDRIGASTGDTDDDLAAIYRALVLENRGHVDLYQPPYRGRWLIERDDQAPDAWTEFTHWAKRMALAVDLDSEERDYKVEMAERLDAARALVESGDEEWAARLKAALNYGNLIDRFFKTHLFDDLAREPEAVRQAVLLVWDGEPNTETIDRLGAALNAIPGTASKYTPGNVVSLASVLLMSRDLNAYPPYRPTPVEKARTLLGIAEVPQTQAQRYDELLRLCDELLERLPQELDDRLDAQGLLWTVVTAAPPVEWSESDRQSFLRWRGDAAAVGESAPAIRRTWFVRANGGGQRDLPRRWREGGFVSLDVSRLRPVDAVIRRDQLKAAIDADYSDADSVTRATLVDDVHQFLSVVAIGDTVLTVSGDRVVFGTVAGEAAFEQTEASGANLRRAVEWEHGEGHMLSWLPAQLVSRLRVQADVVELTATAADLDRLRAHGSRPDARMRLREVDERLADKLHLPVKWLQDIVDALNDKPQVIFYGPPGTGKTYVAQHLAQHLAGINVKLVQFHPAYSYEDFFEGYRPTASGGFELKHGPLRRIAADAAAHPDEAYVLIIDEINRGNIAKIFGELYFLLEYRSEGVDLLYAEEGAPPFALPENLYLIGTMNTADRSIALLDSAIRRRFSFVPLLPDRPPINDMLRSWLKAEGYGPGAAELLERLNSQIDDEEFRVGPSYLMRSGVHAPGGLERVWRTSILPLLEEHHYGQLSRAEVEARYGLEALRRAAMSAPSPQPPVEDVEAELPDVDPSP